MADLVVIVPSRGRPHAVAEMAQAFRRTCTADTDLLFAVDEDDPAQEGYSDAVRGVHADMTARRIQAAVIVVSESSSMVHALNKVATLVAEHRPDVRAIGFLGDDHRPRTRGWDAAYLAALRDKPGLVYGDDLIQGANLPTQVAMSAGVVRALGHMAPPVLHHLYVDNYWRDLGQAAGCLAYLPDVVVEHLHPVAGKGTWDEGYRRVNDQAMYDRDGAAYAAYWVNGFVGDVMAVRSALAGVPS